MSSSLAWAAVNINGRCVNLPKQPFLRCEWDQARCSLRLGATDMLTIDLQVELEVLEFRFNFRSERDIAAVMIFKLCISRPCLWLNNGDSTWRGHLGVAFDMTARDWDPESYRRIVLSISSCFRSKEIKRLTSNEVKRLGTVDMMAMWRSLPQADDIPIGLPPIPQRLAYFHLMHKDLAMLDDPTLDFTPDMMDCGIETWCFSDPANFDTQRRVVTTISYRAMRQCLSGYNPMVTTKEDDSIFEFEYVLVPLLSSRNEWVLGIIQDPILCLGGEAAETVLFLLTTCFLEEDLTPLGDMVTEYLARLAGQHRSVRRLTGIRIMAPQLPAHRDHCDSGSVALHLAKRAATDPQVFCEALLKPVEPEWILENWELNEAGSVRESLVAFITKYELEILVI